MKSISLNGKWNLFGKDQLDERGEIISVEATVPGCVQLDLMKNGYLPEDIYMGMNVTETEKFEEYEWWYEKTFECYEKENVYLVFEGVDCLAEYFLNGVKFGESENMFIAHEFKIDDYLKDGENILKVHIKSPIVEAEDKDYTLKLLAYDALHEARYIRKPTHSYGWDIMPRLLTAGLWKDVKVEVRDSVYFSQKFIHAPNENGRLLYVIENLPAKNFEIEISARCGDSVFTERAKRNKKYGCLNFTVPDVKKWFPYGYGDANIYDGEIKVIADGEVLCAESISFGVRTVELDMRDPYGTDKGQFRFLINGVEIMCKGSNWVPLDAMHCRDKSRYEKAFELVRDIGCNILRCWGGNVYEDHEFFDFCDRNGIMVWQDFSMACLPCPETDEFKKNLEKEATAVIRKLRNHPSIILWSGDNEIDSCMSRIYNPDDNSLTREVLPKCIELNDIGRPYLPSSPYLTGEMYKRGERSQRIGSNIVEDHLWGARDYYKSDLYRNSKAHFVSEAGYHGCPSSESIKKFITPENVWPYYNEEWTLHSSDQHGNDARVKLMEDQVRQLFGTVYTDMEDYILASQISQAEAKKFLIERMRVGRPDKTGIIWWNLLDGWPQMSDAVVDYYYDKKLAYHYIKKSQAPFAVCADELKDWKMNIYACNDTLEEKIGHLIIKDALTEEVLHKCDFIAEKNISTVIAKIPVFYSEKRFLIFEWEVDDEKDFNHYLCGFPPVDFEMYKEFLKKYYPRG